MRGWRYGPDLFDFLSPGLLMLVFWALARSDNPGTYKEKVILDSRK
jgi:hypothetical protein